MSLLIGRITNHAHVPVPPTKLVLLVGLDEPRQLTQLAEDNGLQLGTARKALNVLEEQGLVATHKEDGNLVASCTANAIPALARSVLFDQPRRDWRKAFHGDRPMLLHVLDQVHHPELTARVCDKSRRAVYYAIETHASRGLLVETEDGYQINPRLASFRELLTEMAKTTAHHRTRQLDPDARLLWHLGPELLLRSNRDLESDDVHPGALSRFAEYGVPLMSGESSYVYVATRELDASDAILQALLVDPESRVNRSYAALVYERTQPDNLEHKARIYGLQEEARKLVEYVETREQLEGFLPWGEHDRYREQYGVAT